MNDQGDSMRAEHKLSFSDMTSMSIEERRSLARELMAGREGSAPARRVSPEWGRFEFLPPLDWEGADREARRLLASMSLEQKIGQMTSNTSIEEYIPACIKYNDKPYVAGEDLGLGIPGIKFSDGPAGIVMGDSSTCFPVSIARGATWDVELEEAVGDAMGKEARALGANFFGGVCINLLRHPAWGRSQETYGEDPCLLGAMGSALVKGAQRHVMACVKHFALNSMENSRYKVDVTIDERTLREVYLPHFRKCVEAGAAAVMAAYNKFRGDYCGESRYLLKSILRDDWGFEGIVISDFTYGIRDGAKAAAAGMGIEMPVEAHYGRELLEACIRGEVAESLIDETVLAILRTKILFARRLGGRSYSKALLACPEHAALAVQVARESIVLLKNEGNLLPLKARETRKIAVLGALASRPNIGEMKGSSHVYPPYVVTPLEGLRRRAEGIEIAYAECGGFEGGGAGSADMAQLRAAISGADAVVAVVGLTSDDEGEYIPYWSTGCGGDRLDLGLKRRDVDMIREAATLNPRLIVVLQGGGAIMTAPWDDVARAILMTWYPGMEGGKALAEVLFGDCNPSGKLPLTIPASLDQLPPFERDTEAITYDFYHGYFLADRDASTVAYPFGFGKSYTSFGYSDLAAFVSAAGNERKLDVSVRVENTGSVAGEEVVQIYVGYRGSTVTRHAKDLKAFGRVALEPGEAARFGRTIALSDLAYYSPEKKGWILEDIEYVVYAGASSRPEDLLETRFRLN
jgi:beta-glucosidase